MAFLAGEEISGAAMTVKPLQGLETTPSVMLSSDLTHRVSDLGLGLPGSGVVEPLWAKNRAVDQHV